MEDLPELPSKVGFVSRDGDKLRFTERVYNGADQYEIAGQKQFQPVYTADQMREYARKAVLAERERIAKWYEAEGWLLDESNVAAAIRSSGGN